MNDRQGRIGRQEAAAAAGMALGTGSIFVTDAALFYGRGNAGVLGVMVAFALSVVLFCMTAFAMKKAGQDTLFGLFRCGLGPVWSRAAALVLVVAAAVTAGLILGRFVYMLNTYVFESAAPWQLLLYLSPAAAALGLWGMETLGRTARLLLLPVAAGLVVTLLLGLDTYAGFRLYPQAQPARLVLSGLENAAVMLPGLLGLLIAGGGVHGPQNARYAGLAALFAGSGLSLACQLCLGMTFQSDALSALYTPLYRLTQLSRSGGYFPRLDQLLLFFWVLGGLVAVGYLQYTGGLLWCHAFDQKDVRPAVVMAAALGTGTCLLSLRGLAALDAIGTMFSRYGWLVMAALLLLTDVLALLKSKRGQNRRMGGSV